MSLKKMLLPAALIAMIALLAPCANAQTMGEYATTTAGAGAGAGGIGPSFSLPSINLDTSGDNSGGGSGTWGASRLGASFEERAAAVSGSGMGQTFESRAAALTSSHASESRWPGTGFKDKGTENRFGTSDRFKTEDRFTANNDRFSSGNRWPGSPFQDHMGLDTRFNSVNGN
jgi:hypothetical protein